jgi:hypothetical protein
MPTVYSGSLYYAGPSGSYNIPEEQTVVDGSIIDSVETFTGEFLNDTVGIFYSASNLDVYENTEVVRFDPDNNSNIRYSIVVYSEDVVQRTNFSNSQPTSLKNTNVVWIMRGKRELDNDFITWRNPDNPGTNGSIYRILSGTEKVIGYFYDDT